MSATNGAAAAAAILTCEISGEPIVPGRNNNDDEAVVVTPSGHVCYKRLLLSKLVDNRGYDPFLPSDQPQPLTEEQLITLQIGKNHHNAIVPPRLSSAAATGATSTASATLPALLQMMQKEYDALILELFDTRKALEETRRELSQALYQNDAAVRVVARIAMERDAARQALADQQQLQSQSLKNGGAVGVQNTQVYPSEIATVEEPPLKKSRKNDDNDNGNDGNAVVPAADELPLKNAIPEADLQQMIQTWEGLHKGRKGQQKQAAARAPTKDDLAQYQLSDTTAWHKTSCKGIVAMASSPLITVGEKSYLLIVTAGKDRQVVAYDYLSKQVVLTINHAASAMITSLDVNEKFIAVGSAAGGVTAYSIRVGTTGESDGLVAEPLTCDASTAHGTPVVDVRLHPDQSHVVAASESGRLTVYRLQNGTIQPISIFRSPDEAKFSSGALHPDGLIYVVGNAFGEVLVWDMKSQSLASTLKLPNNNNNSTDDPAGAAAASVGHSAVVSLAISNNGYHIVAAHASGKVRVWDLRKQTCLATLNIQDNNDNDNNSKRFEAVECVAFDESGKYVAYGGTGGIRIVVVKEWDTIAASLSTKAPAIHNLIWQSGQAPSSSFLAASCSSERDVGFYTLPEKE